jgi:hypothetical protein
VSLRWVFLAVALPVVVGLVVLAGLRPWRTDQRRPWHTDQRRRTVTLYCVQSFVGAHAFHTVVTNRTRVPTFKPGTCDSDPLSR